MQVALLNRANFWLVPFGGYPLRLSASGAQMAEGVVTNRTAAVVARVYAETQADVHLALYQAPLLRNGADSRLIAQADSLAVGGQAVDITVAPVAPDTAGVTQTGTLTMTSGSAAITGSGTLFRTDGSWVGMELQVPGGLWYPILSVASATGLTLDVAATANASGAFLVRVPPPRAYVVRLWCDNVVDAALDALAREAAASVSTAGTVSMTRGDNIVTGSGTSFVPAWAGYSLTIGSQTFVVAEVQSGTRLRTVAAAQATASGAAYTVASRARSATTLPGAVVVESVKVS